MYFLKSVFADDPRPSDSSMPPLQPRNDDAPDPNPSGAWSVGGLIKTLARDLEEFGSGLKKETGVIREVASRAVLGLPASLEVGASVAHESLESVGYAIDNIGSSVWRSTAGIITHGRDSLPASARDSDSFDNNKNNASNSQCSDLKPDGRFDAQLRLIQGDISTFLEEPENSKSYNEWKKQFVLEEKGEEIENLIAENGVIGEIYGEAVPSRVDKGSFWSRYFYSVHKLKKANDARGKLVERAISDEVENLRWDSGDNDGPKSKAESSAHGKVENVEVGSETENDETGGDRWDEEMALEGKAESSESERDSDVSVVSSQPSLLDVEDLGWDKIEYIGSNDEDKVNPARSANRVDLHELLSEEEEEKEGGSELGVGYEIVN
ncbi:BSD domain-containing protein 1 [Morella rubra]|uniref:BSD domain-containing protein 1 n=1 Tax=Morella rubra TaxID=262757 RepID=A0A6A1VU15_9ROSI|nr:BSD domain-containing protein 1 [Morella rubra]